MTPQQVPTDQVHADHAPDERESRYGEFVGMLARHDQSIRRFIRSLLPTEDGVDDVMQETALECWKKYDQFSAESPESKSDDFIRWACVIARYKVLSLHRDRSRDRLLFRESVVERLAESAHQDQQQQEAERRAVAACLGKMDPNQRRLVLSVHSPGESVAQIATEMGVQVRRMYSRVNALRKRLLDCVTQRIATEAEHG